MAFRFTKEKDAILLLENGVSMLGKGFGQRGISRGETCFNTAHTGYQEVLTDPSYKGQIVVFTFPHIGNTGINPHDVESIGPQVSGLVLREPPSEPSSHRACESLDNWLTSHKITGIANIDTRTLTKIIRKEGALKMLIHYGKVGETIDTDDLLASCRELPSLSSFALTEKVSAKEPWQLDEGHFDLDKEHYDTQEDKTLPLVVVLDFGVKRNILRSLNHAGLRVKVLPAASSMEAIAKENPQGILLSNGPGDPKTAFSTYGDRIASLLESPWPIFGICLGHQLLALSLGMETERMAQGHRGYNHPVLRVDDNVVEITSQNHGFAVKESSVPESVAITHRSLFDRTIQGIALKDKPVFSVQYHPESSPGPSDSRYLFEKFSHLVRNYAQRP